MATQAQKAESLRKVAQKNEKAFKDAFLNAIQSVSDSVTLASVTEAVVSEDFDKIESTTDLDKLKDELSGPVMVGILAALLSGGKFGQRSLPSSVSKKAPDMLRAAVQQWALEHAGEFITGVTETSRLAIRSTIVDSLGSSDSVRRIARRIKNTIGLTGPQSKTLERMRQAMIEAGVKKDLIDKKITQRADQMKKYRASVIARSEAFAATAMGQQLYWNQLVEDGDLAAGALRKWLTAEDERVCPVCRPMDGQVRGLNEPFTTGAGSFVVTSPAHPVCRCSVILLT